MSKIKKKFEELSAKNEKALIAYVMAGYPNQKYSLSAIRGLVKGGADIIEIGFPFSDPLADGPIIQNASTISLKNETSISDFLKIVKKIRKETSIPLVLMTYTNILYKMGYKQFIPAVKKAGIDGIILPDMPIEESKEYLQAARKNNVDTIFLISPNTSKARLMKIIKVTSGFLYLVSVFGTTGVKNKIQKYTIDAIKNAKKHAHRKIPVGVGFGIYTPEDVKRFISAGADAVIIGSAFLKLLEKVPSNKIELRITAFTKKMKQSTRL